MVHRKLKVIGSGMSLGGSSEVAHTPGAGHEKQDVKASDQPTTSQIGDPLTTLRKLNPASRREEVARIPTREGVCQKYPLAIAGTDQPEVVVLLFAGSDGRQDLPPQQGDFLVRNSNRLCSEVVAVAPPA